MRTDPTPVVHLAMWRDSVKKESTTGHVGPTVDRSSPIQQTQQHLEIGNSQYEWSVHDIVQNAIALGQKIGPPAQVFYSVAMVLSLFYSTSPIEGEVPEPSFVRCVPPSKVRRGFLFDGTMFRGL